MRIGKIILFIFGLIGLLTSMGFFFGGGAIILADNTIKDSDSFYSTRTIQIESGTYAVVTGSADIYLGGKWDWGSLATFKVAGSNNDPAEQIFIGIARTSDIDAYLNGVEYSEITRFSMFPDNLSYSNHSGVVVPGAPVDQSFWTASSYGAGTETLEWDVESGRYSLLLMNGDGSEGIDLDVEFGLKIPWLIGVGIGLLLMGLIGIIISIVLIFLAFRSSPNRNMSTPVPAVQAGADSVSSAESKDIVANETGGKTGMGLEPNVAALLCYLFGWVTGIIFFILEKDNKYVRFHALQSIIVFGFLSVAGAVLGAWPFFGRIFEAGIGIITLVFWIILMIKAYHGEKYKMPWVGDFAEKQVS